MENFNSDLPRHLDLLETQNTEVSGDTHAPAQESGNTHAPAQESSQETEGASAQEIEGVSAQELSRETEGVSDPTSNQPIRQARRNSRYFNNDLINLVISKINGHLQNHRSSAITSPFSFKSQKPNQKLDLNLCFLNHLKWNDFQKYSKETIGVYL